MTTPLVSVRAATKIYGSGSAETRALDDVSLDIGRGEFVAIVGTSGAGKSTLANVIAALDVPTSGSVVIGNEPLESLTQRELARLRSAHFGFVFQSYHLLPELTLVENVLIGSLYRGLNLDARIEAAMRALESVGLGHRATERAKNLSGGQQQRVAIARAIVASPPIIVADEPTGNLDSETTDSIMRLLSSIASTGTTVIVITHDPDVANAASRIIRVDDGRIARDTGPAPHDPASDAPPRIGSPSVLKVSDLWRDAYANVATSLRRLTPFIVSLALAVALVVTTVGLTVAAQAQVEDVFNVEQNRQVTVHLPPQSSLPQHIDTSAMNAALGTIAGIQHAGIIRTQHDAVIRYHDSTIPDGTPVGHFTGDFPGGARQEITWVDGASLESMSDDHALVGRAFAQSIGLAPLRTSPVIEVNGYRYVVVGIIDESPLEPDLIRGLQVRASPDLSRLPDDTLTSPVIRIVTTAGAAPQVAAQAPLAVLPTDPEAAHVLAPEVVNNQRAHIEDSVRGALLAMSALSLFTSFFMLGSMSLSSVRSRRAEFGVRRAMGARRIHIASLMMAESLIIGVAGAITGLFLGIMAVYGTSIVRGWAPVFDWRLSGLALILGIAVSMLASLAGVLAALRIQPADALRR